MSADAGSSFGARERDRSLSPASRGRRSALRWFTSLLAHTKFSQVSRPPRERGTTWSGCPSPAVMKACATRANRLGNQKHPLGIDGPDFVTTALGDVLHRVGPADARIIDQNPNAAQSDFRRFHEAGDFGRHGNVRPDGNGATPQGFDLPTDLLRLSLLGAVIYGNVGSGLRQRHRCHPSDAPTGSGHQANFAVQLFAHFGFLFHTL